MPSEPSRFSDFFSLYQFLSPSDITALTNGVESAAEKIMKKFVGPTNEMSTSDDALKTLAGEAFTDDKSADDIHIISTSAHLS